MCSLIGNRTLNIDSPDMACALETTWLAARVRCLNPWKLGSGLGRGSGVSATALHGQFTEADVNQA